jgi:N-methylhydantoinase A
VDAAVLAFDGLEPGRIVGGPAIVESPLTTVVVDPGATLERTAGGSLAITPVAAAMPEQLAAAT